LDDERFTNTDWIHQFENYTQTNHKRSTINDSNASKIDTEICLNGWFVNTMPDLNQSNPLVLNYLKQNAIWWIEYADLDGFRVDTYNYSDPTGIASWTKAITDSTQISILWAKSGCKAKHKWRIGKRQ
jgi:glycosidase